MARAPAGDDATAEGTDEAGTGGGTDGASPDRGRGRGREVAVPLPIYKTVVVFSTLIAVVTIVGGFLALDAATQRARAPPAEVDPVLALLGLGLIAAGGAVYAYASRFRAEGMETAKGASGEPDDDG